MITTNKSQELERKKNEREPKETKKKGKKRRSKNAMRGRHKMSHSPPHMHFSATERNARRMGMRQEKQTAAHHVQRT
jgi:hypothetical protein